MIEVEHVTKRFASTTALHDVSFTIGRSEIVGILGPNGAGKTTLMRVLTGFLPPSAGAVRIDGLDVALHSLEVRRRIGYLPEQVPLYPEMRVDEYLRFRAAIKRVPRRRRRDRIEEVKTLCELKEVESRIIGQLSRGYWQRVGLADCLVHDPELLILDEPTLGLDPNQIRNIRELIRGLGRRYTILLSTHFLAEAEVLCPRVLILNRGRVAAADAPRRLLALVAGEERVTAELHGPCPAILQCLERLPQVARVVCEPCADAEPADGAAAIWARYRLDCARASDLRPDVFRAAAQHGWLLRELAREPKRLEDVFAEMTQWVEERSLS